MNVLITGGYGFIGMYVTQKLLADGHSVFIYDMLPKAPEGFEKTVNIRGDLLDQKSLFDAVYSNKIDQIVNLAALRNNDSQAYPYTAFKVNCEGFINCLEAVRIFGVERLVYASSVAVLGRFDFYRTNHYDLERIYELPEGCAVKPSNVYGVTKLFNEQMGEQYANIYGLKIIGARLPIIFGSGKKGGSKTSAFNDMIEQSYYGNPVTVELREDKFNITYVKDAAKGIYCATTAKDPKSGVYNTCGHTVDMYEYADTIKRVLPKAAITIHKTDMPQNQTNTCVDITEAGKQLGYTPDFTLEQGILDHVKLAVEG